MRFIGLEKALTCLQFCFEGFETKQLLSVVEIFAKTFAGWFWKKEKKKKENIFNFFLFLSTFAVAVLWFAFCSVVRLPFEFCDFDVSVKSRRSQLLLCSSFLY